MTPAPLTPRQSEYLAAIVHLTRSIGLSPTIAELADHLGVNKVSALEQVRKLADKGRLTFTRYQARSIVVIGRCPVCGQEVKP